MTYIAPIPAIQRTPRIPVSSEKASMIVPATAIAIASMTWVSLNKRRRPALATPACRARKNAAGCTSAGWSRGPVASMVL